MLPVIILVAIVSSAWYWFWPRSITVSAPNPSPTATPNPYGCAEDVKVCPDGTRLTRQGANCSFAECPVTTSKLPEPLRFTLTYPKPNTPLTFPITISGKVEDPKMVLVVQLLDENGEVIREIETDPNHLGSLGYRDNMFSIIMSGELDPLAKTQPSRLRIYEKTEQARLQGPMNSLVVPFALAQSAIQPPAPSSVPSSPAP